MSIKESFKVRLIIYKIYKDKFVMRYRSLFYNNFRKIVVLQGLITEAYAVIPKIADANS